MAKITLDLNKFKASGVYTVEFDSSERIVVTTQTVRLVVGFSRIGPINAPVFLRDVNSCRRIFGAIDPILEKRGSFFHRAMETCLSVGPIFALNLMPLKSTPLSEGGDGTSYRAFALAADEENGPVSRALVASFYNKERFWFPSTEYVIGTQDATPINRDYLFTVVNLSQAPLSVIVRKSVNAKQYEIPARDFYGPGNAPAFMNENDFLSDFFVDLIIVEGDWTNYQVLSVDPEYSKYFDVRGVKVDKLDAFLSLDGVTMVGAFTGTFIPDFIDAAGTNQFIENIVNDNVGLTGIFIAVNVPKIDDYENSPRKIDTIGNTLIGTTDDTIDFMSYNTPIKNLIEYQSDPYLWDPLKSPNDAINFFQYDGGGTGLLASSSKIYVKSHPFGGRSGKFHNVLVVPKPEPADVLFTPAQYQNLVDNLSTGSLIRAYGVEDEKNEIPTQYLKVDNIIDTGTELQIQLSAPARGIAGYEDTYIAKGQAAAIPGTANTIVHAQFYEEDGTTTSGLVPAAGDFILVEAAGFAKYYEVDSYNAGTDTITVLATGLTTFAPYYASRWCEEGLAVADFASYYQPSQITITLFKANYATTPDDTKTANGPNVAITVNANNLVPYQGWVAAGWVAPNENFYELDGIISPDAMLDGYEGMGKTFPVATFAIAAGVGYDSVEVEFYNVDDDSAGPTTDTYYIETITIAAYAEPAATPTNTITFLDQTGAAVDFATLGTWATGETIRVTLVQSGLTFTGVIGATTTDLEDTDINKLRYIETYAGSKLARSIQDNLVVNGDKLKYYTGASQFNYLGATKNYSKSALAGSVDEYSQVAYGVRGARLGQFTDATLDTIATTTYAGVDQSYDDSALYDPSVTLADLVTYSSSGKSISANIVLNGPLFGGGKRFALSLANSSQLNVGDLVVDNGATPRLTRVVEKLKKVNPATGVVTYEYTVLDVPKVDTITNTITRYTPIQTFCDRLQFSLLNGYTLTEWHLPNNTNAQIEKIYGVLENTNISKTLASKDIIGFRYVIDTFNGGIAPQMGAKAILARLARDRQKCMAILNAPSVKEFIASTDPRFTDPPDPQAGNPLPLLKTEYIPTGGNLALGPSFKFTLPDEENGAKFVGVFSPNILIRENNKNYSVPPAADVSNNFVRKFIQGTPFAIVAGPRRGIISNPKFAGLEYEYLLQDREFLEPFGINPIVTVKGIGPMIYANQTAFQRTLSAFNSLHVRDLLITVSEAVEDVLAQYLFEFNDASTRLEIRTIVENYLDTVRNAGGIYDYAVIMDDTNNPPAVIDGNFGILDIGIEPAKGLQKFINRITILKTGTVSSGGFVAA